MIEIDGGHLSLSPLVDVARHNTPVSLSRESIQKIEQSHLWIDEIVARGDPVYGVNTGFGIFATRSIPKADIALLNRNMILSHAVGTGPAFPKDAVRAAMLIRANALAKGHSGIRVEIVQTILEMLNRGVTPVIPSQGSLGSSGDLGPLSTLALVLTKDENDLEEESGFAEYQGKVMSGKAAMAAAGLPRYQLGPKEGLAINNGASFTAGVAGLVIFDADHLLETGVITLAMTLEAMQGCIEAFDERIQTVRGYPGQLIVARNIRRLTQGSTLLGCSGRVQDAYSLRCAPQIQGACLDTIAFARGIVERELNAATDNPLLFGPETVLSGGNFHGQPVGMAMDIAAMALVELSAISERRIFRLIDGCLNEGLPAMLVDNPEAAGLNSGLMMPQYTAAALVLENQTLATPDSIRSLPTSSDQEDINANSMTAARHARQVVENTCRVLAIEAFTAARALDLRKKQTPGAHPGLGVQAVYDLIRKVVPYHAGDTWWTPEIDRVHALITSGMLIRAVSQTETTR